MKLIENIVSGLSMVKRYHYKWVAVLAISWTAIDVLYWLRYIQLGHGIKDGIYEIAPVGAIIIRALIVLIMSVLIVNLLIFKMREAFRNSPTLIYLGLKTVLIFLCALVMNFLLHNAYSIFTLHRSVGESLSYFYSHTTSSLWLIEHSIGWVVLFILSHLLIEINEKYSPGMFFQILTGKYIQPKIEERIVMFMDMKDSTTIAERLDSKQYFMFIRDYIYFLSVALLEYDGRIYQYVGDEIVVSWNCNRHNARKCIAALMYANRLLIRNKRYFNKTYGALPEFKVGIHCGEVTVGEIGIIKKDLVMSGDTMNTAARIRSLCTEYNYNYMMSKEFMEKSALNQKLEHVGEVEVKGKNNSIDVYALMI